MRLIELTVSNMEVSLLNDTSKYVRCPREATAERSGTAKKTVALNAHANKIP